MEHKDYLWYIIPGTLVLFPLIKQGLLPINTGNWGIMFLVLAFVVGSIMHSIYRIIYRCFFFARRPLIKFLRNKLEEIDITVCGTQADYLYNYYIYSASDFPSHISQIRNRSQVSSSIFSCMLGAIFGLIIFFYVKETLFCCTYGFTTIVLGVNYYITFWKWLNDDEKVLVTVNFDKQFKDKKDEIKRILEDIK